MKFTSIFLVLSLVPIAARCTDPNPQSNAFTVVFSALADDGSALDGVTMSTDGRPLGVTNHDGQFSVVLRGSEGVTVPVETSCPDGYDSPAASSIRLSNVGSLTSDKERPPLHISTCIRQERDIVVVVHASGGANLPVLIDGAVKGRTDELGNAHVHLNVKPDIKKVSVSLDTSKEPRLRPENPSRVYSPEGRDAIALFEQAFTEVKPARKRPKAAGSPRRHVPYRMN